MQLHGVVCITVTTESSAEEVRCEILKMRDGTMLALAVLFVVPLAAASSSPVFAQYAPCQPGYGYAGGCYPSSGNPYYNPYNNCQASYYSPNYGCYYPSNYGQYNPYGNCQTGYYNPTYRCYYPGYNSPYNPYNPYNSYNPYNYQYSPYSPFRTYCQNGYYGYYGGNCYYPSNYWWNRHYRGHW